jgi:hypothetical protein
MPRAQLWRELKDLFAAEADAGALARMKSWRAEARAAGERPLTAKGYRALVDEAERARRAGDAPREEQVLREILAYRDAPSFYGAGVRLAELLALRGRAEEGLAWLQRVQVESPALPQAFAMEAEILRRTRSAADARGAAERGLFYNPSDPGLMGLRAELSGE